tara:strand:+ start:879 stop:1175 length:297 start_codon:yes stop_codon:yes gene_type:complete
MTDTKRSDLDFVRDMLLAALDERRDDIVGDLFKMYEEVRNRPTIPDGNINIDKILTDAGTEYNFSLSSDYLDETYAAGSVDLSSSVGADVISFGEYKA